MSQLQCNISYIRNQYINIIENEIKGISRTNSKIIIKKIRNKKIREHGNKKCNVYKISLIDQTMQFYNDVPVELR